jgi:hypothetical protein
MAKRKRSRPEEAATSEYSDSEGNLLELRQSLSGGTVRKIERLSGKAGASADDVWQRRNELLFERLAVRWEIAGLPLSDQAMLLGRYRMATAAERQWIQRTIAGHIERFMPELAESRGP